MMNKKSYIFRLWIKSFNERKIRDTPIVKIEFSRFKLDIEKEVLKFRDIDKEEYS